MKLRTAIIGTGKMGRIRKLEIEKHHGFELVALCDQNESIAAEFSTISFYKNWKLLLDEKLDVVFVCTYNDIAPDIVCAALEKGCHVFCEKPPGRSVEDIENIIRVERDSENQILKFGFNHRFHGAVMEAKAIIDSERYGKPLYARGVYGKAGGNNFLKDWRSKKEVAGGGILLDQGIHMLDLMRYFMGNFSEIKSMVDNLYWKDLDLEDNAFILMRTDDGKIAMLHSSATQWKHKFTLEVYFENGYLTINGLLTSTRSYGEESITFAKKQFEDEASAFGRPREETIYFDTDISWKLENEEFYNCIIGVQDRPLGSSEDALEIMKLIRRIYKSS